MRADGRSCNDIVRRIVNLPLNVIGGVSRAVSHGMTLIGVGRREQRSYSQQPQKFPVIVSEEWAFLTCFEPQFGTSHPFFYACRFDEALKIAEEESKFLFVYLHSPEHPYTTQFCSETLCSELIVQYLDANFVSWGAIANRGEGLQMTAVLQAARLPFCAIVVPASSSSIAVLQQVSCFLFLGTNIRWLHHEFLSVQVEGPVSPAELVEILQRTIEEQGSSFRAARAAEEEMKRANRLLREEQDAAFHAALEIDKEKERIQEITVEEGNWSKREAEPEKKANNEKTKKIPPMTNQQGGKVKETTKETHKKATATHGKDLPVTQIQIRFPNGERKEQSFLCTDKIQSIYRYIDSMDLPGVGAYQLISNFPRKVYSFEQMGMTLREAGLHPRASLFVELV